MNELLVFAKAPRPGLVKTRLAVEIGAEAACAAYLEMTRAVSAELAEIELGTVLFSPRDAQAEIEPLFPAHWRFSPQSEGDLGTRMREALLDAFRRGATRPVVIGTDSPEIGVEDIQAAWRLLESHEIVLGPAEDGGYWLIGARRAAPELFEDIPWSSPTVLRESLGRCERLGLRAGLLRRLGDIDTAEDWQRYKNKLSARSALAHAAQTASP